MKSGLSSLRRCLLGQAQLPLSSATTSAQPVAARLRSVVRRWNTWEPAIELRKASCLGWPQAAPLLAVSEPTAIGVSPPWLLLAGTVVGLPVVLWTYKCAMMIIFQRSIIYMGAWPPGARTTAVDSADPQLRGLEVEDVALPDGDPGIMLRGVALRRRPHSDACPSIEMKQSSEPSTVVVYFQGNMGSPVSRLPLFAHLLSSSLSPFPFDGQTLLLAVCPRSYYLSTIVRPTQAGLTRDYAAVLGHAQRTYPTSRIVVYGHSLGGTAACCLLGSIPELHTGDGISSATAFDDNLPPLKPPHALILENPFPSVPLMIERSLYRSRWLPYHFLSPFVHDVWDARGALGQAKGTLLGRTPVLFVSGQDDSLVLPELVREMYDAGCADVEVGLVEIPRDAEGSGRSTSKGGLRKWLSIPDAHHDNTWARKGPWGRGVRAFLAEVEASNRSVEETGGDASERES